MAHLVLSQHTEGTVYPAEEGSEPNEDGGQGDDGTSLLNEGPATFPHGAENIAHSRHMVCRQLHNERSRVAGEHLCLFQNDTGNNDRCHAQEVCAGCDPCRTAEDCAGDHCDKRLLSAAGDKGGCHNGHTTVTFVLDGSGCHDAWDAAACADQDRDEGLTGQTELTEDTVHNECDTSHVAASLQDCQQDEQYQHLRYKAQNCADTGNDTIQDQTLQPVNTVYCVQSLFDQYRNTRNPYAVVSRIRLTLCELFCCCGQIIHRGSLCGDFQCFFILNVIGEVSIVFVLIVHDEILCSLAVKGICFCVNVAFQLCGVHTLFVQVCHIAVDDSVCVAVFICCIIIRACADAQQVPAIAEQSVVCPACCGRTNGNHGDVVNQEHDNCEDRQTQPAVGDDLIDLIRSCHAGSLFLQAVLDDGCDVQITLVGDDALCVVVHFLFGSLDILFNVLFGSLRNIQLFQDFVITLEDLDGVPSLLLFRLVVQASLFDMCNSVFYTAAELVLRHHGNLALSNLHCLLGSLVNAGAFQCGDLNNLAAQFLCQLVDADLVAVLADNVHHVDGYHYRNAQLHQLCGEVQVTFQVGTVDDVQNGIRTFLDQIVSGNNLFQGVRRKGVDTRQVCDDNIFMTFQLTFLFFYGYTRPVTNELVRTCQCVEQCGFTSVRVTG